MVGELIMLPARIGVRATRLWLRVAEETIAVAVSATGRVVDSVTSRGSRVGPAPPHAFASPDADEGEVDMPVATAEDVAFPAERAARAPASRLPNAPAESAASEPTGEPSAPRHVSEEPVLVEEFAEPGAEEGAGPEVHVNEPWDGYERMNAKDIVARLGGCNAAELAAVSLYERDHRGRHTVLAAVERELRVNGAASRIDKERTDA